MGLAVTFTFAGVVEREADSDRLCEHLSHLLQAVGRVAGACLLAFFHSRLSGFDFPLSFFSQPPDVSQPHPLQASLRRASADCLSLSPLPAHSCSVRGDTADLMLGGGFQPRLQASHLLRLDSQSQADVSHTGAHHARSMRLHELFTLFFCGQEYKRQGAKGELNKI